MYELTIINKGVAYQPSVLEPIEFNDEIKGSPSKLTFTVVKDSKLNFQEGNLVTFRVNDRDVFSGYVFSKKRDRDHHIKVTCYDQIRYLKNKDTMIFENMTASDILKKIASDQNIKLGKVDNTGFIIKSYIGEDISYMDMIYEVLDLTMHHVSKKYVLYDSYGKLNLRDIDNLEVKDFVMMEDNFENFDYESSIDSEVYNQIKLTYKNDDTNTNEVFIAKDSRTIDRWGLLQYTETINNSDIGKVKADILLELYNRKHRKLDIKGIRGNLDVRAGFRILTMLNVGDIIIQNYLIAHSVKFKFSENHFTMDIRVAGGGFSG